ncbi:Ada metal-binding domain-containing protein [Geobacter sp. OR-1]|uniref:Ada metal-binding domain-containing protein n=1 Tax=Geobacter sp. OR-1 TaxID=1266765 RepID=UPI00351C574B
MPPSALGEIWGSATSKSYHLVSCRYVKKTLKTYRIKFDSAEKAREAGYKPCEVCRPPKGSLRKESAIRVR